MNAMLRNAKKKLMAKQQLSKIPSLEHKTILKITVTIAKIKLFVGNKTKEREILVEVYKIINDYFENEDDDDATSGNAGNS